jgi:hypothetical protein
MELKTGANECEPVQVRELTETHVNRGVCELCITYTKTSEDDLLRPLKATGSGQPKTHGPRIQPPSPCAVSVAARRASGKRLDRGKK